VLIPERVRILKRWLRRVVQELDHVSLEWGPINRSQPFAGGENGPVARFTAILESSNAKFAAARAGCQEGLLHQSAEPSAPLQNGPAGAL
jgi:hypothetical protein